MADDDKFWDALFDILVHNIAPFSIMSVVIAFFGLILALAERHKVLSTFWTQSMTVAILSFLFYPKAFLYSAVNLFIARFTSVSFATSHTGFLLTCAPSMLALCFLLFTNLLQVDSRTALSGKYIRNASRVPLARRLFVASHPYHAWTLLVIGTSFCLTMYQSVLNLQGPLTLGDFLSRRLVLQLDLSEGIKALWITVVLYCTFLLAIPYVFYLLLWRLVKLCLRHNTKAAQTQWVRPRLLLGNIALGTTIAVIVSAFALHVALVARLLGLLGRPYESGLPTLRLELTIDVVVSSLDSGLLGALLGSVAVGVIWFLLVRVDSAKWGQSISALVCLVPGIIAFFPSSFLGNIALCIPWDNADKRPILFLWGFLTSFGLATLLLSCKLLAGKSYHYDNIYRLTGFLKAGYLFVRENRGILESIVFICTFSNAVDPGFRAKLGAGTGTLGGVFLDSQGNGWSDDVRGLALVLCVMPIVALVALRPRSKEIEG